jgi:hypothetical protein
LRVDQGEAVENGDMTDVIEALLTAPVGVALLGRLEARHKAGALAWEVPDGSLPASVAAAVADVRAMPIGELLAVAIEAGYRSAGPWSGSANEELLRAYRDAPARVAIAEAVAERLGENDDATNLDTQEWWHTSHRAEGWFATRRLVDHDDQLYGNGEFTYNGVWTVTAPPAEAHDWLAAAWELDDPPISRWRLPVRADARVYEVNCPDDWVALVTRYPTIPSRPNCAWELPGLNDHNRDPALAPASGGRAARNDVDHLVLPQWSLIAQDYDGVRLTWRGWLSTEGSISDTPDGGVTWLRYWFSERTLWLNDVFGEPEPMTGPAFEQDGAIDVTVDAARRAQDRAVLQAMLGR